MRENGTADYARLALGSAIAVIALFLLLFLPAWAQRSGLQLEASSEGWETIFREPFGSELGEGWTVVDASDGDGEGYVWGTDPFTYTSPSYSAWSGGGGIDGTADTYPDGADTWLIYGPVDLQGVEEALLEFKWWLETDVASDGVSQAVGSDAVDSGSSPPGDGDWFGWCVLLGESDFESARCEYVSGSVGRWAGGMLPLDVGSYEADVVWIGFHFVSDNDGSTGRGAFVDDVLVRVRRDHGIVLPLVMKGHPREQVMLPLVRKDASPTPTPTPIPTATPHPGNLLENGGFEAEWIQEGGTNRAVAFADDGGAYEENNDHDQALPGWIAWFRRSSGVWYEPYAGGVSADEEPRRVHSGLRGVEISTTYTKHDAGVFQQVDVAPGTRLRLSAVSHAWSNWQAGPHPDDPLWSEGPGYDCGFLPEGGAPDDDWRNVTFWVGIDPTGGIDPDAETVEWGSGAHIYNCFHEVPSVEVEAQSNRVTVFLRSRTEWPFWHNNAYWDDALLIAVDGADGSGWRYPMIDHGSRVGVHSILPNGVGGFADDLAAGGTRFSVVKAVDDLAWLVGVRETSPETITIGRLSAWELEGCPNVEDPDTDLDEMANALLSLILNKLTHDARMRGAVTYWEIANEPDPPGPEGYRRLAELMITCMEKAERYGLKLALFSLNAGTPEWDEMEAMVETGVFARAQEGGHILALHEGTFVTNDPREGWGQTIPGAPVVDGGGNLNFRYRYLYYLLKERDEVIPLVVSEWYCGDEQAASTQTLVDAVTWYDGEASKDHYFWATCPFTLGPTDGWEHTDYERVYPDLVEYMIDIRDRENGVASARSFWEILLRRLGWR